MELASSGAGVEWVTEVTVVNLQMQGEDISLLGHQPIQVPRILGGKGSNHLDVVCERTR